MESTCDNRGRADAFLAGQNRALELLASGAELESVLTELVLTIEGQVPGMVCSILRHDAAAGSLRHWAAPHLSEDYQRSVDGMKVGPEAGSCGTAAYRRERVVVEDVESDPRWRSFRALARQEGFRSCWSQPIMSSQDEVLGTFAMYYRRPREPNGFEVELIERAANLAGVAIQQRQAMEALEKQRAFLRQVIDINPSFIFAKDRQGRFTLVNQAVATNYGTTVEALIGKTDADFNPNPREVEFFRRMDLEVLDSLREKVIPEEVITDAQGQVHWLQTVKRPLTDAHGVANQVLGVATDITKRKQAEEALRESEARYRALFEHANDAIFITNEHDDIVDANPRACELLGYSRDELTNLKISRLQPPEVRQPEGTVIRGELARYGGTPFETVDLHRDGRRVHVEVSTSRVGKDGNGLILSIVRDITERKRAEQERLRLEDQLRQAQKMEAIGTLAAGVAHDFNNFLTAILACSEQALRAVQDPAGVREALARLDQTARHAGGVVRSLLTFSRKTAVEKRPVHLGEMVNDSVSMLRHVLPASIEIATEVSSGDELWISADASQLQQVVMNLAINARDAMPEGGTLRIAVRHQREGPGEAATPAGAASAGTAVLVVQDTGTGMSDQVRTRVLEPFFTTKPREQGTGLGMAVVHGIVTEHGGRMVIESQQGRGTRVEIAFPSCPPPAVRRDPSTEDHVEGGQGERIILVEDSLDILTAMTVFLQAAGFEVLPARDGAEAMEVFHAHQSEADLVVLDMNLPKKSGLACLAEIREARPDIPVIMATAVEQNIADRIDAHTRLLRKPFRPPELVKLVGKVLRARVAPRAGC